MTKDENGGQYQKSNDEALHATIQIRRRRIRNKHCHEEETGDNDGTMRAMRRWKAGRNIAHISTITN